MTEEALELEETPEFDMDSAVDSLAGHLFPDAEKEEKQEVAKETEESAETAEEEAPEKDEAEEEKEEKEEESEEEKAEEKSTFEAPATWRKEMREFFSSADPVLQQYIIQREDETRRGIEIAEGSRGVIDAIKPYKNLLSQQGVDEPTAVKYLLNAHQKLSTAPVEQRKAMFAQMQKQYGIEPDQITSENEQINALQTQLSQQSQQLQQLQGVLTQGQQRAIQAEQSRAETEVQAFAKDKPHFDELADDIAKLITAGFELSEAYEKALWGRPDLRQAEIDRIAEEKAAKQAEKQKKEAESAKKAKSVNVKNRDTDKAPTAPLGSWNDTMREVMRDIKSRN